MIFLNVPFKEKDEAKQLGAKWHAQKREWYVPDGVDAAKFMRWSKTVPIIGFAKTKRSRYGSGEEVMEAHPDAYPTDSETSMYRAEKAWISDALYDERFWLAVPFSDREKAKELGLKWCPEQKQWYGTESLVTSWPEGSVEDDLFKKWCNPKTEIVTKTDQRKK